MSALKCASEIFRVVDITNSSSERPVGEADPRAELPAGG